MEILVTLLFCFTTSSMFKTSTALDTLSATQNIGHSQTLVSAGGSFELGFFSRGTSKYYLGIWFKSISNGTVVWVANRETPLTNSSGVLKFDDRGNLILFNEENITIWSTNTKRAVQKPVAQLLDSGNFVVREESDGKPENYLWQSFHHPDKTFLPGMKIGRLDGGLDVRVSSWKSADDPSRGNYSYQLDSTGLQMVIMRNSILSARSGPWNGFSHNGLPFLKPNPIYKYSFVISEKETYYTFELVDSSVFTMVILNQNGVDDRFAWIERTQQWSLVSSAPTDNCDYYDVCGSHGRCDISNSPVCSCLDKFMPKSQNNWDRADYTGGCVRRTPLDCKKGDGFIRYSNIKLPDMLNYSINASLTMKECEMVCLKNCSCMAYAHSNVITGRGCYFWFGELVDIKQFEENGGQDLYIRMASSELVGESSDHKKQIVIIVTAVLLPGGLLILGLAYLKYRKRRKMQHGHGEGENLEIPHFHFSMLANATNNFSPINMIGEGGFGPVYKGQLRGQEVAIKRLSKESSQGLNEFMNEVKYIAKLQHKNLVKLLGYCIHREEKMLIYEYMSNKSLDSYIFDENQSILMEWPMRFHIIDGISRGLLYLHHDSRVRIIHRDLKVSNILLDNEMNPKISDFGTARSFGVNETEASTKRVVGTYGYMSPEYAIDGIYSVKSDVFSFGVIVLEIVSGKRNRGFYHPEHQHNLLGHAWRLHMEGRSIEMIDDSMINTSNLSQVQRSIHIGLLCVQQSLEDRPSMSTVVYMLSGDSELPEPKQPGFFTERDLIDATATFSTNQSSYSASHVTTTQLVGR